MKQLRIHQGSKEEIIQVQEGANLLDVLRSHGYTITANCGGNGRCRKCLVSVNDHPKLSCQTFITDDMVIELDEIPQSPITPSTYTMGPYHIAIDLGTTTMAGYLVDGNTQAIIQSISMLNPQMSYGADVITRISQASIGHLHDMHQLIIRAINEIIKKLLPRELPHRLVISGNTVMLHLLLDLDPTLMGKSPYQPRFLEHKELMGSDLGLLAKNVTILPSISSFIGADVVAGCIKIDLLNELENALLIDLGTNGEMMLKVNNHYYATSTAAGPAFEGTNIEKGMGAIPGAISHITYDGELHIETIAGEARGICGSGLIDSIAILRKENLIDDSGLLVNNPNSKLSSYLKDQRFFITNQIYITQKDIREFQLAKSAIRSGIRILLDKAGVTAHDVSKVYVAGGFGFFMNQDSGIVVGIIPEEWENKLIMIGNSSGFGSAMVASNPSLITKYQQLIKQVVVVDLNQEPSFNDYFIQYLSFDQHKEDEQ